MFGYIYKTTIINPSSKLHNHFYIGQKQSITVVENYYGSGRKLRDYIKKHINKSNFKNINSKEAESLGLHREILASAEDINELNTLEAKFVNQELDNPLCLNLMTGGFGRVVKKEVISRMRKTKLEGEYHWFTDGVNRFLCKNCPVNCWRVENKYVKPKLFHTDFARKLHNKMINQQKYHNSDKSQNKFVSTQFKPGHINNYIIKIDNKTYIKQKNGLKQMTRNKTSFTGDEFKGMMWFTNGKKNIRSFVCPKGFVKGITPKK